MGIHDTTHTKQGDTGASPLRDATPDRTPQQPAKTRTDAAAKRWFWNPFAANVSFTVNGNQIRGKDGSSPSEMPTLSLFPGATFSADKNNTVGNKRGKMEWVEGHDGMLSLNAPHLRSPQSVSIEHYWIGLRDTSKPGEPSIMLNSRTSVTVQSDRHTLTARLLFKPETQNDMILDGVEIKNSGSGDTVLTAPLAHIDANGITSLDTNTDLFGQAEKLDPVQTEQTNNVPDHTIASEQPKENVQTAVEQPKTSLLDGVQQINMKRAKGIQVRLQHNDELRAQRSEERSEQSAPIEPEFKEPDNKENTSENGDGNQDDTQDTHSDEGSVTDQALEKIKEQLDKLQEDIQEFIDKLKTIPDIADSWKLGEQFEGAGTQKESKSDGRGNSKLTLPIAEVPILLPFIFGEVNLIASTALSFGIEPKVDTGKVVGALQSKAQSEMDEIIQAKSLSMSPEEGQQKIQEYQKWIDKFLDEAEIKVGLGVYLLGNAEIGLQLAANAGLPGILVLQAGVMGSVGIKGSDQGRIASGSFTAVIHLNGDMRNITVEDAEAIIKGGIMFYLALTGNLGVSSPLFQWNKDFLTKRGEKALGAIEASATFKIPGKISSPIDLVTGWNLASTQFSAGNILDGFTDVNPADAGFNIFDNDAYEIPIQLADDAIESANMFAEKCGPFLQGSHTTDSITDYTVIFTEADGIINQLNQAKRAAQEIIKVAMTQRASKSALTRIEETRKAHLDRVGLLEQALDRSEVKIAKGDKQVAAEKFYESSSGFNDFLSDETHKEAEQQFATRDRLLAYERERLREKENDPSFVKLKDRYQAYDNADKSGDPTAKAEAKASFIAFYLKEYSSSPLVRNYSMRGDLPTLLRFEEDEFERSVKKRKDHLDKMKNKCEELNIAPPVVEFDENGYRIVEGPLTAPDGTKRESAKAPNRAFYDFYLSRIDSDAKDHLAEFTSKEQLEQHLRDRVNKGVAPITSKKQKAHAKSVLDIYEELCALDPSNDADFAAFKKAHASELTSLFDQGGKEWLFMSGADIKRYEIKRAVELAPNVKAISAAGKKTEENAKSELIARSGLITLVHAAEVAKYQKNPKSASGADRIKLDEIIKANNEAAASGDLQAVNERIKITASVLNDYAKKNGDLWKTILPVLDRANASELQALLTGVLNIAADQGATSTAHGSDWNRFFHHVNRVDGTTGIEEMSREDALRLYVTQEGRKESEGAGAGYLKDLRKRYKGKFAKSSNALEAADYSMLRAYLYTLLDNQGFKVKGTTNLSDRPFRVLESLKNEAEAGKTMAAYAASDGGKAFSKELNKHADTEVSPLMLYKYEESVRKQLGARHIERIQLIKSEQSANTPYEVVLGKYKSMVVAQSRRRTALNAITRKESIEIITKFDKALEKQGVAFQKDPKEALDYEQRRIDAIVRKHRDRIKTLEGMKSTDKVPASFLATSTKRFMKENKESINKLAEEKKQAAQADPKRMLELYLAYEKGRVERADRDLSRITGGPDKLSSKISEIDARIDEIRKLRGLGPAV